MLPLNDIEDYYYYRLNSFVQRNCPHRSILITKTYFCLCIASKKAAPENLFTVLEASARASVAFRRRGVHGASRTDKDETSHRMQQCAQNSQG